MAQHVGLRALIIATGLSLGGASHAASSRVAAPMTQASHKATCETSDIFAKAWGPISNREGASDSKAWIWRSQSQNVGSGAWTPVDAKTCSKLEGDAGAVVSLPTIFNAISAGPKDALVRQTLFRFGIEHLGEARMHVLKQDGGGLIGPGTLAWPAPHRGPVAALGIAQPTERPSIVPAQALAFLSVSVSPGRLWQELEGLVGGLWPLETTLVGTQISAWEQEPGHGLLSDDVFGYASALLTVFVMPQPKGPSVVLALPVAKPELASQFIRWAVDIVSAFAPALQASTQIVQGQTVLVLRGVDPSSARRQAPIYVVTDSTRIFVSKDAAMLVDILKTSARGTALASAPLDASAPKTAVAFGSIKHQALPSTIWQSAEGAQLSKALNLKAAGCSVGWMQRSADGFAWQTSSTP